MRPRGPITVSMSQLCVARQPIFDRRIRVVAYELLFRPSADAAEAAVVDDDGATAAVLLNAFSELGIGTVVGGSQAYINVPWQMLVDDPPLPGPAEQIVIELLEGAPPTPAVVGALWRAKARGYRIALDDFVYDPSLQPLLAVADIVKVDVLGRSPEDVAEQVRALSRFGVELLAEKVETHEQFEVCRELGFDAFQGFFLSRPRTLSGRTMPTAARTRLAMLATLADAEIEPEELAASIGRDAGLSYKLLRYINSAFFALPRDVSSVRDALTLLGTDSVRRWASLLVLAGIDDRPHELLITALVRARTCELLAGAAGEGGNGDAFYTTGLMSVVDALMDIPLKDVLAALPLDAAVRAALDGHRGPKGAALAAIKAYERGEIEQVPAGLREAIGPAYLLALSHAGELAGVGASAA